VKTKRAVTCQYCGKPAELVDSARIYGASYGNMWLCHPCGAYVGCVGKSNKPLGTLANAELRTARKAAHRAFDRIWRDEKILTRVKAYEWLSEKMGKPKKETHIAMFDVAECEKVIDISVKYLIRETF